VPPSIKDDLLVRLYALDSIDPDPLRNDVMARQEHHRDRAARYERILKKRFPDGTASPADIGKLLTLRLGLRHENMVADWCEEALTALSELTHSLDADTLGAPSAEASNLPGRSQRK